MKNYLDDIVAFHRERAKKDDRHFTALLETAKSTPTPRPFRASLASDQGLSVIAEIKRRSPSKGTLAPTLIPDELAKLYETGGASCLSVLTDKNYFGGSSSDLEIARQAVSIPVLRKDFTVSSLDICDARIMGADAVLLIVAALGDAELTSFLKLARELLLGVLVEVHDETELARALGLGATMIGVNQRDLTTFKVDSKRALTIKKLIPDDVVTVAESGIGGKHDARPLFEAGFNAILVGEHLVTSLNPVANLQELAFKTNLGNSEV